MRCPYCSNPQDKVIDSRPAEDYAVVRRRRECKRCHRRFTTYERVEQMPLMVVKRDGRREPFNTQKIRNGILKACEKRPISIDTIDRVIGDIENDLRTYIMEVKSEEIGKLVLKQLRKLDEVAYVRFASVYRQFKDVGSFVKEVKSLKKRETTDKHR